MNNRQKEVIGASLNDEKAILQALEKNYTTALADIKKNIKELQANPLTQSKAYQLDFQKQLEKQLTGILDNMQGKNFASIADYLNTCYNQGFLGTMYDLQGQGVPLVLPIDQQQVLKAVQKTGDDIKLANKLNISTNELKKQVLAELQRGIATELSYNDIARNISNWGSADMSRSRSIARTEGHRVQNEAKMDSLHGAKKKGADVVKQWDSTLDGNTRETHVALDGQIRELNENFSASGASAPYPGGFGDPAEDCNCRCCMLQRARWAVQDETTYQKWNNETGGIIECSGYEDFKTKYLNSLKDYDKTGIILNDKMFPSTLAGVERGKAMTFDEADGNKANPNFSSAPGYRINCQSCVVSNEARRRGYNVETLSNTKGSTLEMLSRATNKAWIDPQTGKYPAYIFDDAITTAKKFEPFLDKTIEEGNRYTLQFTWKGRGHSGHIICADRMENGVLRLYDPQIGKAYTGTEISQYLTRFKYQTSLGGTKISTPPKILRVDDKEFNMDVVEKIMKGAN